MFPYEDCCSDFTINFISDIKWSKPSSLSWYVICVLASPWCFHNYAFLSIRWLLWVKVTEAKNLKASIVHLNENSVTWAALSWFKNLPKYILLLQFSREKLRCGQPFDIQQGKTNRVAACEDFPISCSTHYLVIHDISHRAINFIASGKPVHSSQIFICRLWLTIAVGVSSSHWSNLSTRWSI